MTSILRFFQFIDAFPVRFSPSIRPSENKAAYKSPLGGIIGLIIYTFGFYYSVDLIMRWFNSEMVMKVSSQQETYSKDIFKNSGVLYNFEIKILSDAFEMDDPFKEDENIIIPMMINITDRSISNVLYYHEISNKTLQIVLNDSLQYNDFYLIFIPCIGNEQFLSKDQKCANQEKSDKFYSSPGLELFITFSTFIMDIYTKEITETDTYTFLFLSQIIRQNSILQLDLTYFEFNQGFLFKTKEKFMLQTDFSVENYYLEAGQLDRTLIQYYDEDVTMFNVLGSIMLTTGVNVNHVAAEYPTISEILASIGSTIQTLLLVKYLIFFFNENRMFRDFQDFLRELYFPEIKQVSITGKGKNKQIFLGKMQLDPGDYKKFLKKINSQIENKMNFANLIYEISRIQIVLQEIAPYEVNKRSHLKRSAFKLRFDQTTNLYKITNSFGQIDYNNDTWFDPLLDPFIFNYNQTQKNREQSQNKLESIMIVSDQCLNSEEMRKINSVRHFP